MKINALILLIVTWIFSFGKSVHGDVDRFYEELFSNKEKPYDRRVRPYAREKPMKVEVYLRILSLRSVSEITMDYQIELYFRENWLDPRLAHDPQLRDNFTSSTLHSSLADQIWTPDTYFPNAYKSKNPDSRSTTHRSFLRIEPDGRVLYSRRLSLTAECPMDLSDGYAVNEVIYRWRETESVILEKNLELPEFKIRNVTTKEHNVTLLTGVYTRLECCFFLARSAGFFFVQLFLPSTAIVVMSWLLLWMERTSKFSDMIEVILAITVLYYSYISVMPRVSYIKAMDIYLGVCFVFVFISLIKLYAMKMKRWKHASAQTSAAASATVLTTAAILDEEDEEETFIVDYLERPDDDNNDIGTKVKKTTNRFRNKKDTLADKSVQLHYIPSASPPLASIENDNENRRNFSCRYLFDCLRRLWHFCCASLGLFPLTFVCFAVFYFIYFLFLVTDTSEKRCSFVSI